MVVETSEKLALRAVALQQEVCAVTEELRRRKKAVTASMGPKPGLFQRGRKAWEAQKLRMMRELIAWYDAQPAVRELRELQAQCDHKLTSVKEAFWAGENRRCTICGKEVPFEGRD